MQHGFSPRNSRWSGGARESRGRGHCEKAQDREVGVCFQPGGNETVGTDEDAANPMLFGPVDEAGIVALQGKGLRTFRRPDAVERNEARIQRGEDPVVAAGQHQGGIGLEPERNPLVAGEKLIELAFALRGPDLRLRRHLADQGVSAARGQNAPMDRRRWQEAPASDEGAEAA